MAGEGMYCAWEPCGKLLPVSSWEKSDFCSDECAEYAMAEQKRLADLVVAHAIAGLPMFGSPLKGDEPLPAPPAGFSVIDEKDREIA